MLRVELIVEGEQDEILLVATSLVGYEYEEAMELAVPLLVLLHKSND